MHLLVTIDKLNKLTKTKSITSPVAEPIIKSISILIYQSGVPHSIITDYASVDHPQSNGQIECINRPVLQGNKP